MNHVKVIRAFIETLMKSESFHALVVQSPPGWGKTTTVNAALSDLGVEVISAGSYATSLHFFNLLCRHPDRIILLDDCAGLLHDPKAMAILKAATWPGANPVDRGAETPRRVSWGSTSEKVEQANVEFTGKLILLSNTVPAGRESEAFLSRALHYKIQIDSGDVGALLLAAAESPGYFSDPSLAREVALFLLESRPHATGDTLNLRTLKLGYEIAAIHPTTWKTLLPHLVPAHLPGSQFDNILKMSGPVKEQEAKFVSATGLSRRTFYYRKQKLGASRAYRARS